MSSTKPDSLYWRTLVTEVWTSNVVQLSIMGLGLSVFVCELFNVYRTGNLIAGSLGLIISFVLATLIMIGQKWPSIRVYKTGQEFHSEKIHKKIGARRISQREREKLNHVLEQIAQQQPSARGFNDIFILDMPAIGVFTIGNTIYITAQTLDSPYLGGLVAHELGHIQNGDGTVMLALRLLFQLNLLSRDSLSNPMEFSTGTLVGESINYEQLLQSVNPSGLMKDTTNSLMILGARNLVGGSGFGVRQHMKEWSIYFREQDYHADEFAIKCGYGQQLVDYLDEFKLLYPSNELAWQSAPELRIDRLLAVNSRS